jgi:hypothetical protein
MQFLIGGICFIGGLAAMIFVGSLKLSFGLTAILAVPLVVLAVYGLARIPTEAPTVEKVHGINR